MPSRLALSPVRSCCDARRSVELAGPRRARGRGSAVRGCWTRVRGCRPSDAMAAPGPPPRPILRRAHSGSQGRQLLRHAQLGSSSTTGRPPRRQQAGAAARLLKAVSVDTLVGNKAAPAAMEGMAPEGSQFDGAKEPRREEFFTSYDEVHEIFDDMGLKRTFSG